MDILAYRDPEQHLGECTRGLLSDELLEQLDRPLWVGGVLGDCEHIASQDTHAPPPSRGHFDVFLLEVSHHHLDAVYPVVDHRHHIGDQDIVGGIELDFVRFGLQVRRQVPEAWELVPNWLRQRFRGSGH
jgi:hypothetical protein